MPKTVFSHYRNTENVGDRWCCPADYFDFQDAAAFDKDDYPKSAETLIYGGGLMFSFVRKNIMVEAAPIPNKVVWGIGLSSENVTSIPFEVLAAQTDMIGCRNKGVPGCKWLPCVSAMSPHFDTAQPPQHDLVQYFHGMKSQDVPILDNVPLLTNQSCGLKEAIDFIASGETVVTNSYHGTYWALCLGRKVLCLPFSEKFGGYGVPVVKVDPSNWKHGINKAKAFDGVLENARELNQKFFQQLVDRGWV